MKILSLAMLAISSMVLASCKAEFDPIDYGHDACAYCKMTIIDKRYAAEVLTKKGKAYKFDDIACLKKYIKERKLQQGDLSIFVADYNSPESAFLNAQLVVYLHNDIFKSPMNGCYAAFAKPENARTLKDSLNTDLLKWENLN